MSKDNFNPEEFKISQRQSWDSVAAGWQKWWKTIEKGAQKVSDKLVDLALSSPIANISGDISVAVTCPL